MIAYVYGTCEYCGEYYEGIRDISDSGDVKCQNCQELSQNWNTEGKIE